MAQMEMEDDDLEEADALSAGSDEAAGRSIGCRPWAGSVPRGSGAKPGETGGAGAAGGDAAGAWAFGQALAPLRDEGVLIVGSGSTVHNLRAIAREGTAAPGWAKAFDDWIVKAVEEGDVGLPVRARADVRLHSVRQGEVESVEAVVDLQSPLRAVRHDRAHGAAGGVGLAAVDLAKALGARVIYNARGPKPDLPGRFVDFDALLAQAARAWPQRDAAVFVTDEDSRACQFEITGADQLRAIDELAQ